MLILIENHSFPTSYLNCWLFLFRWSRSLDNFFLILNWTNIGLIYFRYLAQNNVGTTQHVWNYRQYSIYSERKTVYRPRGRFWNSFRLSGNKAGWNCSVPSVFTSKLFIQSGSRFRCLVCPTVDPRSQTWICHGDRTDSRSGRESGVEGRRAPCGVEQAANRPPRTRPPFHAHRRDSFSGCRTFFG